MTLIYHTGDENAVVGTAQVSKAAYPETKDAEWLVVELTVGKPLKKPVSLAQIKADKRLSDMVLVRASRLSVQPVKPSEFDLITGLSETK